MLRPDGIRLISLARPPVNAIDFAFVRAIGDAPHDAAVARAASLAAAPAYATIKRQLEAAMRGHVLAQAELMGTYARKR